ncbi:MAG: LamG domain-containing protein [Phycisphaerae bacterium]
MKRSSLMCLALVGAWLAAPPAIAGVREGDASITIKGQTHSYHYRVFEPRELIDFQDPPSPPFRTPRDALQGVFFYMKEGRVVEWREMWVHGKDTPRLSVSDTKLRRGWERWMAEAHYLLYEIRYGGQTICVTERGGDGRRSRAKFFFKKVGNRWRLNRDLYEDPFAAVVDSPSFDPLTGVLSAEPTAMYHFESLKPRVEVVDSATVPFLNPNLTHSINNGAGVNIASGEGVKGKAIVLDGTGHVTLPPSVPLSLYNNRFTLSLWVKAADVPTKPENDLGGEYYGAAILSRAKSDMHGHLALEIREPKSARGEAVLFLQVGAGADALIRQTPFSLGRWVLVEVAYDHGYLRLTVDGKDATKPAAEDGAPAPDVKAPFVQFVLGKRQTEPSCPFVGSLDELSISNEVVK